MWIFLQLLFIQGITGFEFFSSSLSLMDQCNNICRDVQLPTLEPDDFENIVCQTGCRFFNMEKVSGNVKPSIKRCYMSCKESFVLESDRQVCNFGCDLIASARQDDIQKFIVINQGENIKNELVLGEPDLDLLETDLLSDPSIKSQLEIGFNIDYKIPETHIRTMPIENYDEHLHLDKSRDAGDWLDCASKNSGIPRYILVCTMLGAVMVAVWLTLSMENRRGHEDCEDDILIDFPDDKILTENYIIEKDPLMFENGSFNADVKFLPPPKYSEINELNASEPPKYSEAVNDQERKEDA